MNKHFFFIYVFVISKSLLAGDPVYPKGFEPKKQSQTITFTENKGQVSDQNNKPRPDVLFGGNANGMVFHLRNNGISYQLNRVDSWKTEDTLLNPHHGMMPGEKRKIPDQISIYRIDINWSNCNKNFTLQQDESLPGYANYFHDVCPKGVYNVKTYKGVTYRNIYNNIDLHYYAKDGDLKYDYVVSPYADYKQIQLKVEGAEVQLQEDGSLLIESPLGKIQEQAPLVYQNGKQLKARYNIKNNIISFEVENYNAAYELIIDPVTRLWGTYYGGTGYDFGTSCTTDASGNVYPAGYTPTNTGTVIATAGSHQSALVGGSDAFLVKFNSSGVRQWGTYYGGTDGEQCQSCATDAFGNVYIAGVTTSTTGAGISTPGCHQISHGGGNDAFLAKFNSSGVLQWGTYYGGPLGESGYPSCCTDASGNVYLSGITNSATGTVIATAGSHQSAYGGGPMNAFLVKFNSSGVRQWGTYYGCGGPSNADDTYAYYCTTDATGNVYMTGSTQCSNGTVIATPGSHKSTASGGGNTFAYLVKFNGSGVRQWGTYYGGASFEPTFGFACATDVSSNVYMAGYTRCNTGTNIATPGSHQSTHGGTVSPYDYDAYLVKFNSLGVRQWGTYYGGTDDDFPFSCATDASGNIYMAGFTQSTTGTNIATPGSHQSIYGGGHSDAFLVEFNSSGVRQWGTYYGGTGLDDAWGCATDAFGGVYMAGYTNSSSGTVIASAGSHQDIFGGGNNDPYLVKFYNCTAPLPTNTTPTINLNICSGKSATLNAIVTGTLIWYATSTSTSVLGTGTTFITPTLSTGAITYFAEASTSCGINPVRLAITVSVNPSPTITVNSGTVCSGKSFTIIPSGVNTYTYSGGSNVVSPLTTTNYTVTGTSTAGCTNTLGTIITVSVRPTPTITVNSGIICKGQSFTIVPSGAINYTFSGGSAVMSPTITTSYSVSGTSTAGCMSTQPAISNVTVNPTPTITVSSGLICLGQTFTINPTGANTYTVSGGNFVVSPTVNTNYSVTGTSSAGCVSNAALASVTVNPLPIVTAISNPSSICLGESAVLSASGANNYIWTPSGNTNTILVTPTTTTTYSVIGTDNKGCSNSSTVSILIKPNPSVSVNNATICSGTQAVLNANVNPNTGIVYNWLPGGENSSSINVNPNSTTVYSVTVNLDGCIGMTTSTVNVVTAITPNAAFSYNGPYCTNQNLVSPNLSLAFSNGGQFSSIPPGLNINPNTGEINLTTSEPGIYQITYTLAASGCSTSASGNANIQVTVPAQLNLAPQVSLLSGEAYTLNVSGASSYTWSPPDFLSCTNCQNPIASPPYSMTYCVSSPNDICITKTCISIIVETGCESRELSLPNAFSPNGDGSNDEYCLRGWNECIAEFKIIIYNRWGEKVYESEQTEFCWDGSYKGKTQETEVFVYMLKAKLKDGTQISKNGNITLLR